MEVSRLRPSLRVDIPAARELAPRSFRSITLHVISRLLIFESLLFPDRRHQQHAIVDVFVWDGTRMGFRADVW